MEQYILDALQQLAPHVQPWHVGAALLVLATFKQCLWLARKLISFRLAALATGAALVWVPLSSMQLPDLPPLSDVQFWSVVAVVAILSIMFGPATFLTIQDAMKGKVAPQLSSEAAKILETLDRMESDKVTARLREYDNTSDVILQGDGITMWLGFFGNYMEVHGVPLKELVPSRSERRKVLKHADEVRHKLMAEVQEKKKQAALSKLDVERVNADCYAGVPAYLNCATRPPKSTIDRVLEKLEKLEKVEKLAEVEKKIEASPTEMSKAERPKIGVQEVNGRWAVVFPPEMNALVESQGWATEGNAIPFGGRKNGAEEAMNGLLAAWDKA